MPEHMLLSLIHISAAQASNEWNVRQDKLEEQLQQEMARKQFQAVKKRIQEREELSLIHI